jgi:hypothetical protein
MTKGEGASSPPHPQENMTDETVIADAPRRGRPPKADTPEGMVWMTVTKAGDGHISTGEHVAGVGDVTFKRGDRFLAPEASVEALEAKHYAEAD